MRFWMVQIPVRVFNVIDGGCRVENTLVMKEFIATPILLFILQMRRRISMYL